MSRIKGKVAKVLTERDLVINKGDADGVEVGMRFKVLNKNGTDIRDPDNPSHIIGTVEMTKVVVKVVSVQEHLAVARTFKSIDVPPSGALGNVAATYGSVFGTLGSTGGRRVETLRSSEKTAAQEMDEKDSYIRIGDPVVQVVAGDAEDAG